MGQEPRRYPMASGLLWLAALPTPVVRAQSVRRAGPALAPRQFEWLSITHTKPRGWLLVQERIQAQGLGGHLQDFFLNGSQWVGGSAPLSGPHSLETVPYWLYGLVPLASQLEDADLLEVVRRYVSRILDGQRGDGWIGPWNASAARDASHDPWPRYRLLSVLAEYADVFGDSGALGAMHRLALRLRNGLLNSSEKELRTQFPWAHARWFELVENVQFLIDTDPDDTFQDQPLLLELADLVRRQGLDWGSWYKLRLCSDAQDDTCFPCRDAHSKTCPYAAGEYFCEHGVNVAQSLKFWALDWRLSRSSNASVDAQNGFQRMDFCHGQPGAVFSAHEVSDGIEPNRGTETCHVVEAMNSYAELFATFGDPAYLDRLEAAAFNRLPAPYFNGSMWAMQYFHQTNAFNFCNAYSIPFECCPSNGNQGWPRFAAHLYAKHQGGIAVVMYAPSAIETTLQDGHLPNHVRLTLDTDYPFGEGLSFACTADHAFPLWLRIPSWAHEATVQLPGEAAVSARAGAFHRVMLPAGAASVRLVLPMRVRLQLEQAGGVSVHAGPLLYALDLAPQEQTSSGACYYPPDGCPARLVSDVDTWRRALVLDGSDPQTGGLRVESSTPRFSEAEPPFASVSVPVSIRARAVVVPPSAWPAVNCTSMEAGCRECAGPPPRDVPSDAPEVDVKLVPFGATDVRMGVLPFVWRSPPAREAIELV